MLTKTLQKIKVVQSDDPEEYEAKFNKAAEDLAEYEPEIKEQAFNGTHCAYFRWAETKQEFNLISDEFHAEGIHYLCAQCPLHDPADDGRRMQVWCKYHDCGTTHLKHEACEYFYKLLKQNEIKPVY